MNYIVMWKTVKDKNKEAKQIRYYEYTSWILTLNERDDETLIDDGV